MLLWSALYRASCTALTEDMRLHIHADMHAYMVLTYNACLHTYMRNVQVCAHTWHLKAVQRHMEEMCLLAGVEAAHVLNSLAQLRHCCFLLLGGVHKQAL